MREDLAVAEAVAALVPISGAPDAPRELAAYLLRSDHAEERGEDDGRKDDGDGDGDDDGDDDAGGDGTLTPRL